MQKLFSDGIIELLNRTDVLERRVAALMCGGKTGDVPDDERETSGTDFTLFIKAALKEFIAEKEHKS